jgi:hypothetical protein
LIGTQSQLATLNILPLMAFTLFQQALLLMWVRLQSTYKKTPTTMAGVFLLL